MLLIAGGGRNPRPRPVMTSLRVPNPSESLANHKAQQFDTLLVLDVYYKETLIKNCFISHLL